MSDPAAVSLGPMSERAALDQPRATMNRLGPLFATIWLFYLGDPLVAGWADRGEVSGVAGLLATVAFGGVYMTLWLRIRGDRMRLVTPPPATFTVPYLGAMAALAAVMIATLGERGMAATVYLAVATVIAVPIRLALGIVATLVAGTLLLGTWTDWGSQASLAFGIAAASVAMLGMRALVGRNIALLESEQRNARLAVENERTRFARDLHDILGHSLTVITVKVELAGRLLETDDPAARDRARAEVADLERLSRDALADVRRAVAGYRDLTLPGEIARARAALEAAEIRAELPNSTDEVPSDLRELFAWTVREGVTNVLRHSGATTCRIELRADAVVVRDDGAGCPAGPGAVGADAAGGTGGEIGRAHV